MHEEFREQIRKRLEYKKIHAKHPQIIFSSMELEWLMRGYDVEIQQLKEKIEVLESKLKR